MRWYNLTNVGTFRELDQPSRTRQMEQHVLNHLKQYNKDGDLREAMDAFCFLLNNEINSASDEIMVSFNNNVLMENRITNQNIEIQNLNLKKIRFQKEINQLRNELKNKDKIIKKLGSK
jgi:hypothetical protein